ncbi:MAG: PaaI family thioesterase [Albidovulum sp.]|nr:PaaI family thioesterase [Albidovulum sp.]
MEPKMTKSELSDLLRREFPQCADTVRIESVDPGRLRTSMTVEWENFRPGGTISGPTMFFLADVSVYLTVLAHAGPVVLAVTTNCSIDFMRRPSGDALHAKTRLLKLGRRLAVADAMIYAELDGDPVARASLSYALPSSG